MPKASAREFHRQQFASITGKPSARSRPVSPGVIERWEGLRRLLPEPTPSPRLWAASPDATPVKLCEYYYEGFSMPFKLGTFYLAGNRNFLFGSDMASR